ncbi:MAG: 50S ribosomal protein L18 [Parcubacteria group bacterium]|nr:MAG: 50S ribosomal protein L18 [Parcubacteria group bacterium]
MIDKNKVKKEKYLRRQHRTRFKISGTALKPRVSVFRSLSHIKVQAIDDVSGRTLASVSDQEIKAKGHKTDKALSVGVAFGKKLSDQNITAIIFDRGAYKYHGRVKALAEGIRQAGIKF